MSTHIWRCYTSEGIESGDTDAYCVSDEACFPVKEAMRLCKSAIEYQSGIGEPGDLAEKAKCYYSAVARMKAKKGKK
jgi:hypothetical protein